MQVLRGLQPAEMPQISQMAQDSVGLAATLYKASSLGPLFPWGMPQCPLLQGEWNRVLITWGSEGASFSWEAMRVFSTVLFLANPGHQSLWPIPPSK